MELYLGPTTSHFKLQAVWMEGSPRRNVCCEEVPGVNVCCVGTTEPQCRHDRIPVCSSQRAIICNSFILFEAAMLRGGDSLRRKNWNIPETMERSHSTWCVVLNLGRSE